MNKSRINRLERNLGKKKGSTEIPIFLDREGDVIYFPERLLFGLGINPEEYPIHTGMLMDSEAQGREVPIDAPFISHITGDYLHLKGFENRRIILIEWEYGDTGD
jgi:hypothetical protein